MYKKLLKAYGVEIDTNKPLVSKNHHGVKFEPTNEERGKLEKSDSPYIRFFLDNNPHYAQGDSIPVIVWVRITDLLYSVAVYSKNRVYQQVSTFFKSKDRIDKPETDTLQLPAQWKAKL